MAGKKLTTQAATQSSGGFLLGQGSTDVTSAVFSVTTSPVRLVAYGLSDGDSIAVHRVLLPSGSTKRDNCGDLIAEGILAEQAHQVGCSPVVLCASQPEIIIDATGDYKVIYSGDTREDIIVEKIAEMVTRTENNMRGTEACCEE